MKIIVPPIFKKLSTASSFPPPYIFEEFVIETSRFQYLLVKIFLWFLELFIKIRLRALNIISHAHHGKFLPQEVVDQIYTREAASYEWKHHHTTNFRDTWWRRAAAFHIVGLAVEKGFRKIKLLDIGTGTGLSLKEMFSIFKDFNFEVEAVGLDYNSAMLEAARTQTLEQMKQGNLIQKNSRDVIFVRGDARNLRGIKSRQEGLSYFGEGEFDFITLICGAGGIHLPLDAFGEQLALLKEGGHLIMIDIHRPLFHLIEHWPAYFRIVHTDLIQYVGWNNITVPLVLRDLWGWQDPTPLFYLLPFTSDAGSGTGFRIKNFELLTEKWWFGLPVITTGRLVLEKVKYSEKEIIWRKEIQKELCL